MRKLLFSIVLTFSATAAACEETVIAALGDSLTQGYGLPAEDGLVAQLQDWLGDQAVDVRLINAGVSGDTTAGGLARVDWTLTPEVDGLIVALGGNDLLRGLDPAEAERNLDGILQAARARHIAVLLIGMQAPGNYGADYKARFDAIYPELSTRYDTVFLENFFAGMIEGDGPMDPAEVRQWFQADGIHPNAAGVARLVTRIGPKVIELIDRATE